MSRTENMLAGMKNTLITKIAGFVMNVTEKRILRERMVSMVQLLLNGSNPAAADTLLENMGRTCCQKYKMTDSARKYRDNPQYFLDNITRFTVWDEKAEHDPENGIIKVTGIRRKACVCPFAKALHPHLVVCDTCCAGFQKELFEALLDKPVNIRVDESVLKGNDRCSISVSFN